MSAPARPTASIPDVLGRTALGLVLVATAATILTAVLRFGGASDTAVFGVAAVALAGLAGVIGAGTDQLGHRLGPGKTGVCGAEREAYAIYRFAFPDAGWQP